MNEFKVGDRVIGTGISYSLNIEGYVGTVRSVDSDYDSILVYFDEEFDDSLHSFDNRCWYVGSEEIELYFDESDSEQYIYTINQESFNNIIG